MVFATRREKSRRCVRFRQHTICPVSPASLRGVGWGQTGALQGARQTVFLNLLRRRQSAELIQAEVVRPRPSRRKTPLNSAWRRRPVDVARGNWASSTRCAAQLHQHRLWNCRYILGHSGTARRCRSCKGSGQNLNRRGRLADIKGLTTWVGYTAFQSLDPTIRATSVRTTGSSSVSNQGLRFSHALFRHDGWGMGTRRG